MHISHRQKLNLIDNYVAIYRILFHCKELLSLPLSKENISTINRLCDQTLDLKHKYECAFEHFKMVDSSLLLLKQQLSSFRGHTKSAEELCTIHELKDSLTIIENDYTRLKLR